MFRYALDENNNKFEISQINKNNFKNKYICPLCNKPLYPYINHDYGKFSYFYHKNNIFCDQWYKPTSWELKWQLNFPSIEREVVLNNKHIIDVLHDKYLIKFIDKFISSNDFINMINFYKSFNEFICVFDFRKKNIKKETNEIFSINNFFIQDFDFEKENIKVFFQINDKVLLNVKKSFNHFKSFKAKPIYIEDFLKVIKK